MNDNQPRMAKTKDAAKLFGFDKPQAFLHFAKSFKDFPRPRSKTNYWWDVKAIDQWLDKHSGINPESVNYDEIIQRRMNNGGLQNGLRH